MQLDTRTKIVTVERALEIVQDLRRRGETARAISGHFDVLQTSHIQQLSAIVNGGGTIFAIVENPPAPLMEQRARAELVAALAMVDYVVPVSGPSAELLGLFTEVVHEEAADEHRTRDLIEHVRSRHR